MKTGILASPTISEENMQGSVMGMSMKGVDIAAYFLRDKIYSNKVLAVIREYICNAVDEHRKHSISKDVDVRLVNDNNKWYWSVRDYAKGLDEHGVRNIFGMYFESTKGEDNDSIGGFGIGSKAGLSYSDTFYITSWNNGVKDSYICSLGAGKKGIPVGEIFDISKGEPTTESGIEIRIDVDSSDVHKFNNTSIMLIESFTNDVGILFESDYYSGSTNKFYTPFVPELTIALGGGYILSRYAEKPTGSSLSSDSVGIRMGGVIYEHKRFSSNTRDVAQRGYHIIDVPIGRLTIPISREGVEDTPSNRKVYEDIKTELYILREEDRKKLTLPTFGKTIDDNSSSGNLYGNLYNFRFEGEWYTYLASTAYPDTYMMLNRIKRSTYSTIPRASNGKHTVYMIPDIKNQSNWHEKLNIAVKTLPNYVGHLTMTGNPDNLKYIDGTDSLDVSDIEFIDVKDLKLPPLPKAPKGTNQVQYLVFYNGSRQGSFTPDELEAHVIARSIPVDLDDEWWKTVSTLKELNARTISCVKDRGMYQSHYTANSEKMVTAMHEMGWLSPSSQDYIDTCVRINKEEEEKEKIRNAEPTLRNTYFDTDFHPHIIRAIVKDATKIERLRKVSQAILKEDSTRGRILRKLTRLGNYDGGRKISREDLRKIIALK